MEIITLNYLAVVAATAVSIVLGFLWFGPVFGKQWMAYMGLSAADMDKMGQKGMTQPYVIMAIASLVMAYVLAHFVVLLAVVDAGSALQLGFWTWLGFIATVLTGMVLWEGKPWGLYAITAGYYLVSIELQALILALWR